MPSTIAAAAVLLRALAAVPQDEMFARQEEELWRE
jgi:hypothetical protein